jgi:cytoskeletal protein CcmA (bactofilin family)
MFNKQVKPTSGPAMRAELPAMNAPEPTATNTALAATAGPAPRKSPKMASLIADDITIEGNIIGDGELHVDGVIRGDVRVPRLSVGETGHIEGTVQAEVVETRGRIVGSVTAKQVKLLGTCYVDGDITHEQLTMETGAFFQGRSLKFQRQPAPVAAPMPVAAQAPAPSLVPAAASAPAQQPTLQQQAANASTPGLSAAH